ncbi:ArnT family glycosyltransferase [Nonomuraea sp. NPDC001699]
MALAVLLLGAGVLYVWGLGASGWADSFYSAAVQAGSQSWKAFFFGSSDAANAITVDKTPASLWPMALSVRIFGLNSWAVLVPQALMGVGAVAVVYATVRRSFPAWAALLAGTSMAVTPVAVLMFRFNNPDALLVLSLTVAGYCVTRARERGFDAVARTEGWNVWLGPVVAVAGLGAALVMLFARRARALVGLVAVAACLAGPEAYALDTAATPHTGAILTAGPATAVGFGRPPGGGPRGPGGASAQTGAPGGLRRDGQDGRDPWGGQDGGRPPGGRGGAGGLLDAGTPPAELTALLRQDDCTWTAATVGSNNAAAHQLAAGLPVMAVGGFNGTDPAPTLARFKEYVAQKRVHYFIGAGMGGFGGAGSGGSDEAARIAAWVRDAFTATTVGGVTVFDLTS